MGRVLEKLGIEREAGVCIEDYGLRIAPICAACSELWIVRQHGTDTHQNAVMSGSKSMRKKFGLWSADLCLLAGLRGNAAVDALGVGQCDQRSARARVMFGSTGGQSIQTLN